MSKIIHWNNKHILLSEIRSITDVRQCEMNWHKFEVYYKNGDSINICVKKSKAELLHKEILNAWVKENDNGAMP